MPEPWLVPRQAAQTQQKQCAASSKAAIVVPVLARAHGKPHAVHRYSRVIVAAGGPAPSSGPAAMPQTYLQQPVTQCNVTAAHSLKTQRRS
jgi:hypothetical protein